MLSSVCNVYVYEKSLNHYHFYWVFCLMSHFSFVSCDNKSLHYFYYALQEMLCICIKRQTTAKTHCIQFKPMQKKWKRKQSFLLMTMMIMMLMLSTDRKFSSKFNSHNTDKFVFWTKILTQASCTVCSNMRIIIDFFMQIGS